MSDSGLGQKLRIVIVGGGLGGLACCLALQLANINAVVYERDKCFADRREGFGLTLTNNKKGPLAKLGILEECIQRDCPSNQHWVFLPTGDILGYYGRGLLVSSHAPESVERGNLRIPRQDLRQVLLSRLRENSVVWGRKLVTYCEGDNGVDCTFEVDSADPSEKGKFEHVVCDVLVGADGLRSSVRQIRDNLQSDIKQSPLRYIGISVIIGLSTAKHNLVDKGGFYVVDGVHRLFVMPFSTENDDSQVTVEATVTCGRQLTMWQLSFSGETEASTQQFRSCSPEQLIEEALRRTKDWMRPVRALITETDLDQVWGTPLYDREPMTLRPKHASGLSSRKRKLAALSTKEMTEKGNSPVQVCSNEQCSAQEGGPSVEDLEIPSCDHAVSSQESDPPILPQENRMHPSSGLDMAVTVIGDACHPMCMFKGQGCNQALEDGPLLASWLSRPGLARHNLTTRLRCFEREMIARSSSKVKASHEASKNLHSHAVLATEFGIEGVPPHLTADVICALREHGINASLGPGLLDAVKSCLTKAFPAQVEVSHPESNQTK